MFSVYSLDEYGPSGASANRNQYRVECHDAGRSFESTRHSGNETMQGRLLLHTDDAVPGTDHANIGDVGGAARQNSRIGCGDVRVGTDDSADSTVQMPAHRGLFGRGFGVHVTDNDLRAAIG